MMTWLARNFPRRFGIPEQTTVYSQSQLFSLIKLFNGECNCYLSVNAYDEKNFILEQIVFDFDGDGAYQDAIKASSILKELKITHRLFFSGKKGYHLRIPVKSQSCNIATAKKLTRTIQFAVATGLKSFDPHLLGDVKRILRIPNTQHILTKLYCVEIPEGMNENNIIQYAQKPHKLTQIDVKTVITAESMAQRFEKAGLVTVKNYDAKDEIAFINTIQTNYEEGFVSDGILQKLFPQGCYRYYLRTTNPPHTIRVGSCIWLVYLGFDVKFILKFYEDLAYKVGWDDKDNKVRREKAIYDLCKRHYNPMSCWKIKERGYCKKEVCEWVNL